MLTIGLLACWFIVSALLYGLLEMCFNGTYDEHRGMSSFCFLFAQGLSAAMIWGLNNAIY